MIRSVPLTILLTSGLVAVTACGGDDSGGEGEATLTATDADSSGAMTMTTADTMTTVDTMTTEDTMTTVDPDSSSGDVPAAGAAFRFNSVAVRDPHFFFVVDITDTVNSRLSAALTVDDPKMPDGLYDLDFVLSFDPLDQADAASGALDFANADCTFGQDPSSCVLQPTTMAYPTTFTSSAAGPCQEADPANLNPDYTPALGATTGPCFVTAPSSVTIATTSFSLPLEMATVAARYVGDPAGNLVEGTIIGFVTIAAADAAIVSGTGIAGIDGSPVSGLLQDDAMDEGGTGWWFHMEFTAVAAEWNG